MKQIDTPCLVLDKQKLLNNLELMQAEVKAKGKNLRPHVKTHKCTILAKLQVASGALGMGAAKVSEALQLAQAGLKNTLITSPVVTALKLEKLVECRNLDDGLIVVCDTVANAKQLNDVASVSGLTLNVVVDIDPGVGRTGITHDGAIELAHHIQYQCASLKLLGIQCYAGNLQHIADYSERKKQSTAVMQKAAQTRQKLLEAGLPCQILTGSGTGTYDIDMSIGEVTEAQPGSYTVMDMEYRNIGSASDADSYQKFQPAMTLLTTVISANHPSHVTVDAGTKAIYFDMNTQPKIISHQGLHYDWSVFGDEHGKITADPGVELPKVGEVIEMVVPHCDPTINLYDEFNVVEDGVLTDVWPIDLRGCVN